MQAKLVGLRLLIVVMGFLISNSPSLTNSLSAETLPILAQESEEEPQEESEEEPEEEIEEESKDKSEDESEEESEDVSPETLEDESRQIDAFDPLDEMNALTDRAFWQTLQGSLPCLEYVSPCVLRLQELAVGKSPLLSSVDEKLEAIAEAISDAEVMNSEDKKMSVLKPALVFLATPETIQLVGDDGQARSERRGILNRVISIVTNPAGLVNDLVGAVAQPLADYLTGGSQEYKRSTIAIAGLSAEAANLRIDRQKLELEVRRIIDERLAAVDNSAREYRLSLAAIASTRRQAELYKLSFGAGQGELERMIALESSVDNSAGQVISRFTALRTDVNRLKFLAYGGSPIEE